MTLAKTERRQLALITAGAVVVFFVFRLLPTGTNLNHMDFRVEGKNSIEFCDPANPQFIPVVSARSPVAMTVRSLGGALVNGTESKFGLTLATASGKPVAPEDLLVTHTRKLHLLIADEALTDYQHVHPTPGAKAGEWSFSFTPRGAGTYRIFADFTPAATGRGLYAAADVPQARPLMAVQRELGWVAERGGFRFALSPAAQPLRAGRPADLKFSVTRTDGGEVVLEPVMGAYAHLVAFDEGRSGFAHLHPLETDVAKRPEPRRPELNFKITIPQAGRYVIWAQVSLGGREEFVPFWFDVAP